MDPYHFAEVAAPQGAPLLFLFHGTGGDETGLIGLGSEVMPGAHLIAPRGDVSEHGALRFFRRTGEGVYDMADFARATEKMSAFLRAQIARVQPSSVVALGYSNGANILAAVLFAAPELVAKSVLMHPLIPFEPAPQPGLAGRDVLVTAGRRDPIAPAAGTERLSAYFVAQGARSRVVWHEGGHELRREELLAARDLLAPER
ncbi:MAG: alpha/beta hydrolase [Devosia sp.]|nr:alpha/beta hydrolase [Devosia sp.]